MDLPKLGFSGLCIAILIMIIGMTNLITGKRLILYLLFLNGLLFFSGLVIMISGEILKDKEVRLFQTLWIILSSIFFGLIGGLLCSRFYKFGASIMGLLMGHIIGEVICQAFNLNSTWENCLIWSLGIILAIISALFVDFMIVINTSFLGAQLFMIGLDYIVDKGYSELIQISIRMKPIECTPTLWAMVASSIIINLLGMLIQFKAYKNTQYYKIEAKK